MRRALQRETARVCSFDALTYAGDPARLMDVRSDPRLQVFQGDVADAPTVVSLLREFRPHVVVHYAAESHVTRAEDAGDELYRTNVEGTRVLLEACESADVDVVIHVSTDEVYGPVLTGIVEEDAKEPGPGRATTDYARSKAVADDTALSFASRIPVIVVRPSNIFGSHQFPEKAISRWITRALQHRVLPVWGGGKQIRQWLHVDDLTDAIELLIERGVRGKAYNIASPLYEIPNLEIAKWIARRAGISDDYVVLTSYDRPKHDFRYASASNRLRDLGWRDSGLWGPLDCTFDWYSKNSEWWLPHLPVAESIYQEPEANASTAPN